MKIVQVFVVESYDKHLKHRKNYKGKWTTEIRQGEFIYSISFKKSNILFHCAILSFVILNSIQCLEECSNSQWPNV